MAATLAAGLFFYSSCTPAEKTDTKDYTQYVNTFIGGADNGHTFPGACYPFGMIQTSPVTGAVGWRYCSEYVYEDSLIWGFTQTHLNGTGCMDLGDILVMPVTGTRAVRGMLIVVIFLKIKKRLLRDITPQSSLIHR